MDAERSLIMDVPQMPEFEVGPNGQPIQGALFPHLTKKELRVREIVNQKSMDAWDKCWEEGIIPWDVGGVTPIIAHLAKRGVLPEGRALVPGCGAGYDVLALASPNRHVVGLDISEKALQRAKELAAVSPNGQHTEYMNEDFFTWTPPELFDLIFDYTFLVAMDPSMRPAVAKRFAELLKPDGELLTLMFPLDDHVGGPPYAISVETYEELLHPLGFTAISIEDNEFAIESRKGREMVGRWKRMNA